MKASLLIVLFFILGVLVSYFGLLPKLLLHADINSYVLYLLMFVVGIGIGSDEESLAVLRNILLVKRVQAIDFKLRQANCLIIFFQFLSS